MRARSESSSRSSSRTSTNRDRVQCFKCREYDHFANECPNLVPKGSDRKSDGTRSACLTEDQAKHVYDKIESGDELKVGRTVLQQSQSNLPIQVKEKDDKMYEKVLISDMNTFKNNSQMEQWPILSDNIVYVR